MQNPLRAIGIASFASLASLLQAQASYTVSVDAAIGRHGINPLIYGVSWAPPSVMKDLNAPLNRAGGNSMSRYNWQINADNRGNDWYFESIGDENATPGYRADSFITDNKSVHAQSMFTIPMVGWVAKLGANRSKLASFSIAKYGAQTGSDYWMPDAGNGISASAGNPPITGNDPNDANVPSDSAMQQGLVQHIVDKFGQASSGGLRYYLMDNEASIWFATHRDVHPVGPTMDEMLKEILDYGGKVKAVDPTALVVGPEEWGWNGYLYSGYDQWYMGGHNWQTPDREAHGGMLYVPYLLQQLHKNNRTTGKRILDVLSLHIYPQDGSGSGDVSPSMQALRNRSTRSLWDPNYVDQSWINDKIYLIPRMKQWIRTYYPGTKTAITEYNWGAEGDINGATTQADIFGIFGREDLDMATRWTYPDPSTPTYKAMKMYRNYDGRHHTFGNLSVQATVENPDNLASYAAIRTGDGALTVMVINKVATTAALALNLSNFTGNGTTQVWQLTSANAIRQLCDLTVSGNSLAVNLPAQSVTLFVMPPSTVPVTPPTTPTGLKGYALDKAARLTWKHASRAMGYTVLRSTTATGGFGPIVSTTTETYTDHGLINGKAYYYKVVATNSAGSSDPTNAVKVVPHKPSVDPAQYGFESGTQGWASSGGLIASVTRSSARRFLGAYSLAVSIAASGTDAQLLSVGSPAAAAGAIVTFHVWIPSGCGLDSIQPYVLQDASGGWTWTGNWQPISSLTPNAWNTITVQVPGNAAVPLYSLGVQFSSSKAWTGTCYVDSVGW